MAFLESKYEYSEGARIPILAPTSLRVRSASPFSPARSHAAVRISLLVASRRSSSLLRDGVSNMIRSMTDCSLAVKGDPPRGDAGAMARVDLTIQRLRVPGVSVPRRARSEEHTSELQSLRHLV